MKALRHVVPLLVVLTLATMLGGCSKNTTPTGLAPLDQAPPATPSQVSADMDVTTGIVQITWTPSSSANAAGYQVYQYLPTPNHESAYVLVGETDAATTHCGVPWPPTLTESVYYRLCTVSATGVKSAWTTPVQITLGPPVGGGNDPEGIHEH